MHRSPDCTSSSIQRELHLPPTLRARRRLGFTLTELLITVAIAGILASAAYPGYKKSILKVRRSDGITAVLALQLAQERFRASCPFYAQSLGHASVCGNSPDESAVQGPAVSAQGYYALSIERGSAGSDRYVLVARPINSQADDVACSPMTISFSASQPNGLRSPVDCW